MSLSIQEKKVKQKSRDYALEAALRKEPVPKTQKQLEAEQLIEERELEREAKMRQMSKAGVTARRFFYGPVN